MNIISQNFKDVLKNKIKVIISTNLYKYIDFLMDNFSLTLVSNNNYFNFINLIDSSIKSYILSIISSTFEEFDSQLKNSSERKSRYYINKSNVARSITTIFGTVYFKRTLFKSKLSNKYVFLLDKYFNLPKYDHYDPIIKSIAINNAFHTSQAQASRDISFITNGLSFFIDKDKIFNIPRQSIYNWIKKWKIPNVIPKSINTPDTLYVMADEKYISSQNSDKDIMVKCFVTFEDVKPVSKNRNQLSNRFVFSTCSKKPWKVFMDKIALRYDFTKIKNIALIGDGGNWIKSGISELRLDSCNLVKYYLCEFHFKQAIHHITTDKLKRKILIRIFKYYSKKKFIKATNIILKYHQEREKTIKKNIDYIINNYSYIKNMLNFNIGSSMESHISHLIASFFSSRPKGFSTKNIDKYLLLNDYKNNNINIFNLYLKTYTSKRSININENEYYFTLSNCSGIDNIPILKYGHVTPEYITLRNICHH